ncbi:MAG: glycoside hydrolase family 28 protein [Sedimentisphaerales bacterium]|nr:glycoside hydrolase family 28 protein [Sedimentisphaerales bacterium]
MNLIKNFCFILSMLCFIAAAPAQSSSEQKRQQTNVLKEPIEPIKAPFPMPELKRPVFPNRVVDIRSYGAVGDGKTKNTKAFAKSIEICAGTGGGRVLVPAGKWLTGPIHLKSNIELHLAEGAEIIFSDVFEDYLPNVLVRVGGIEIYNYSPLIYARDCENIAVTGPGKLNGNAKAWWDAMRGRETREFFDMGASGVPVEERVFGTPEAAIRPSFLSLVNCCNVLLEGFTIGSGPNWTIHPVYCQNVIIRRVNIVTSGPNNDGIDPDSCRNVLIEHCMFDTGDDCVVLKSGYNEDGWRVGMPTENVVMRYCVSHRGHGGLVVGSEMSGDVRNVYMHDCEFEGTDRAIRIKSRRGRGGVVENVWAHDLKVKNMQREVIILNMDYSSDRKQAANEKPPVFRNFDIWNVTGDGAPTAILINALEDSPVENIKFRDITIKSKRGVVCSNVRNIMFDNVQITPEGGPLFDVTNGQAITIEKSIAPEGTDFFLKLSGPLSKNIMIIDSDLTKAATSVSEGQDVPDGAVVLQKSGSNR